jgi:hypothetical protein
MRANWFGFPTLPMKRDLVSQRQMAGLIDAEYYPAFAG